jgi:hypothetical protein
LIPCRSYESSGEPQRMREGRYVEGRGDKKMAGKRRRSSSIYLTSKSRATLSDSLAKLRTASPPDLRDGSSATSTTRKLTFLACRSQPQAAHAYLLVLAHRSFTAAPFLPHLFLPRKHLPHQRTCHRLPVNHLAWTGLLRRRYSSLPSPLFGAMISTPPTLPQNSLPRTPTASFLVMLVPFTSAL